MTFLEALLQGIIQGLTEFLPVSSSGHLSLFQHFFGLSENGLFFSVMLHVGTLLAVFIAFRKLLLEMLTEFVRFFGRVFTGRFRQANGESARMVLMIITASVPLLFFYFAKDVVEAFAEDGDIVAEGVCFIVTGALLFAASGKSSGIRTAAGMSFRDSLVIGVAQGFASLPGISRSGATISAGMLLGYSREFMVSFSFILGIPAVAASSAVELAEAVRSGLTGDPLPVIVGMAAAGTVGFFAIRLIQWIAKTGKFRVFAYYTLALGLFVVVAGAAEKLS